MECVWEDSKSGLLTKTKKQTKKQNGDTKIEMKTKKAFVNTYKEMMDILNRSPYYSSIRLCLRSSITIIHVKIKSIITFIT